MNIDLVVPYSESQIFCAKEAALRPLSVLDNVPANELPGKLSESKVGITSLMTVWNDFAHQLFLLAS